MGIKICVLKNVTQQKNQFWKRPTITWIIAKKLLKNRVWGHSTIFNQFFVHKSWQSHSFSKRIVFLSHIFQDANFDTHNSLFWEKKMSPLKGALEIFKGGVGPLKKYFFQKQILQLYLYCQNTLENHYCGWGHFWMLHPSLRAWEHTFERFKTLLWPPGSNSWNFWVILPKGTSRIVRAR